MKGVFFLVLNMSLTASYAAAVVMLVRLLLKKAPKVISYALWSVVLFRLVCPFSFESALSLLPGSRGAGSYGIPYFSGSAIDTGTGMVRGAANQAAGLLPVTPHAPGGGFVETVMEAAALIWAAGILVLLAYGIVSYSRLKHRLSEATLVRDNIFETDRVKTSFVLGFIKPRIYLPVGLDKAETDYIVRHEQTHIWRGDYIVKPLAFLALALHWFNPVIWLCYFLMVKDMEMSCDESVIGRYGQDIRASYSSSLLSLSARQNGFSSLLAFGETNVKSRIKNVLNYKKPNFWVVIAAVLMVLSVAVSLLANPRTEGGKNTGKSPGVEDADKEAVISLVEAFGSRLQYVSLLAPEDILVESIRANYGPYVSPALLEEWVENPQSAPGRLTSSPWPDRIEVLEVEKLSEDQYEVRGNIIEVTSVEKLTGGAAAKYPVVLMVRRVDGRWLIDAVTITVPDANGEALTDLDSLKYRGLIIKINYTPAYYLSEQLRLYNSIKNAGR